ncbi:hypothetical protein [Mesorhizobium silamurunense]|uniref:hypothetical protein n=1 Tax=Mesorhizobium silamurunense TaxID=499528 RepID=UPI00177EF8C8|nr:hypothetical protein [Mesorhizobium silamurunense]
MKTDVNPIRLFISGEQAAMIARAASAKKCRPDVLVSALLRLVLEGGMEDAILDGDDPHEVARGHRKRTDGLTHLQAAMLYQVALHSEEDGWCRLPIAGLALVCGDIGAGTACSIINALERQGFVEQLEAAQKRLRPRRLTDFGWSVARQLGGEGLDGSGGTA